MAPRTTLASGSFAEPDGQLALLEPPAPKLTYRQATILTALQNAGQDGLDADQAGALWHHAKRYHGPDQRCTYCAQTGKGILDSLKAKDLAYYRRANRAKSLPGIWLATDLPTDPTDDTALLPGMSAEIPY